MSLADQALEADDLRQARTLVEAYRPRPGEEDLRGWEWRYLWQQTRDASEATLRGHEDEVTSVAFSADGSKLASGRYGGTIRIWDARSDREIAVLRRKVTSFFPRRVLGVAFTSDGQHLVSISRDGRVEVWDLTSRAILRSWAAEKSNPDVRM